MARESADSENKIEKKTNQKTTQKKQVKETKKEQNTQSKKTTGRLRLNIRVREAKNKHRKTNSQIVNTKKGHMAATRRL